MKIEEKEFNYEKEQNIIIYIHIKYGKTPSDYDIIKDAKKRHKKWNLFRTEAKPKYKLWDNRLYYKYYFHNRTSNKKNDIDHNDNI